MLSFDMLIYDREKELLNAQKKVLAQWINQTLNKDDITPENFMHVLDNGVILCNLIRVIQYKAEQNCKNGLTTGVIPSTKFRCWENAKSQSFFARDNTENFLKWCRSFGVNEAVIFESDGLVRHTQPRNVVLCLLELGRLASRFGISPPASVRLEKNGEDQDCGTTSESESVSSVNYYYTSHQRMDATMCVTNAVNSGPTPEHQSPRPQVQKRSFIPIRNHIKLSDLDKRVLQITAKVLQDKDQLKKVSDGLYTIRGKNVFVKLLKDNHVVVRVGGGWDTLDHFLSHHSPQQVKSSSQKASAPGNGCPRSPTYVVDSGTTPRLIFQNKTKHRGPFFTIPRSPKHKCC